MPATETPTGRWCVRRAALIALAAVAFLIWAAPARATDITPIFEPGNPTCSELGYGTVSVKIDNDPAAGTRTYSLDNAATPTATAALATAGSINTVTVTIDTAREFFDWAATLGVDAVLAKGGPNLDAYLYDPPGPERLSDTALHAPINSSTGRPFQLSHIDFCFDYELSVTKTAVTSFKKTFAWTIDKSVSPATWNLFRGDSGTSDYKVALTKDAGTDSDWAVDGQINIKNQTPFSVPLTNVTDKVSDPINPIAATVTCPGGLSQTLPPNGTLNCIYHADLPDAATRTNTARAVSGRGAATPPPVGDGVGTATVDFAAANITKVNDSVTVSDSVQGSLGTFSASGDATYSRKFTCDADEGPHPNTATISPASASASPSDSATVAVHCFALAVDKTANTSFTRKYAWTIDKVVSPIEKTIATGDSFSASYSVTVDATTADSAHKVTGNITVSNPAGAPTATINAVSDAVSGVVGDATVNCGAGAFPRTLAAGGTLTCTYEKALPDRSDRMNTATATLQNHTFSSAGTPTNAGTTNFTGTAGVTFGAPTTEVDKSIDVSDAKAPAGTFTTVTFGTTTLPKTFTYARTIGPYGTCGDKTDTNTASFLGSDGGTGSDSATVTAHVECKLTVTKTVVPSTDAGKFNLLIDNVAKATNVGDGGTTGAQQVTLGSHTVSETAGTGTTLSEYVTAIGGDCAANGTVSFASGSSDKTCTITNTKKGRVTARKTTDGVVNPTRDIKFLLTGPGLPSGGVTLSTFGDADGVLDFGYSLTPGSQYTVCENPVPAGFTSFWKLDGTIVTPYNPNATDSPPQDLGVRCFNFSATAGQTRAFDIDNSHPGGEPRTIGYWKNWNKCTGGNQAATAAKNGGAAAGVFIVEDLLPQTVGNLNVTTCAQAVNILGKKDQAGVNHASDAAYELASQLLAAKLNLAAGAKTCGAVQSAVVDGQALLVTIAFTGSGDYLVKASANRTSALNFATTLAKYNMGTLC